MCEGWQHLETKGFDLKYLYRLLTKSCLVSGQSLTEEDFVF